VPTIYETGFDNSAGSSHRSAQPSMAERSRSHTPLGTLIYCCSPTDSPAEGSEQNPVIFLFPFPVGKWLGLNLLATSAIANLDHHFQEARYCDRSQHKLTKSAAKQHFPEETLGTEG